MDISKFYYGEKLYRAVKPIEPFMSEDGTRISSGAFTQPKHINSNLTL